MPRLAGLITIFIACLGLWACAGGNPSLSVGAGSHGAGAGFHSGYGSSWPFAGMFFGSSYSGRPYGGLHFGLPLASAGPDQAEACPPPLAQGRAEGSAKSDREAGNDESGQAEGSRTTP